MNEIVPFSYAASGQVLVLADGPELLVFSGANDQGMWKVMGSDIFMGVGSTATHVHAVDGSGRLLLYRAIDGTEQSRLETRASPMGMEVAEEGQSAILTANAIVIVRYGGEPQEIRLGSPRCARWRPPAEQLAVGGADGQLHILDGATGEIVLTTSFPDPIRSIAWRATGQWAVAHGRQVDFLDPETLEIQKTLLLDEPIQRFTVSDGGGLLAAQVSDELVQLYELASDTNIGEVEFQRTLYGLAFGPAHWLAFGFEDGDANRLDVLTGKMTRTQAHAGRAQNAWAMNVRVNHAQVRGAVVGMAAGGHAIAKHNVPKIPKKRSKWMRWVIGGVVVVVLLSLCCGVSFGGIGLFTLW